MAQQEQREYRHSVPSCQETGYLETSAAGDLVSVACTVLIETLFR